MTNGNESQMTGKWKLQETLFLCSREFSFNEYILNISLSSSKLKKDMVFAFGALILRKVKSQTYQEFQESQCAKFLNRGQSGCIIWYLFG